MIFMFLVTACGYSQDQVFTITEEMAEFPGGTMEMSRFIQKALKYPDNASKCHIGGKVFLKFIVGIEGNLSNVEVVKSSGSESLDQAAIDVITAMPRWKPAKMSGRSVRCYFNLPINFKPEGPYIVFNTRNENTYYNEAKQVLLERAGIDQALSLLQKDVGDADAWYVMGVLNYIKGEKGAAKNYFENVSLNSDRTSVAVGLCEQFLAKYF